MSSRFHKAASSLFRAVNSFTEPKENEATRRTEEHISHAPIPIQFAWAACAIIPLVLALVCALYAIYYGIKTPAPLSTPRSLMWALLLLAFCWFGPDLCRKAFAAWFRRWIERQPGGVPPAGDPWEALSQKIDKLPSVAQTRLLIHAYIDTAPMWLRTYYRLLFYIDAALILAALGAGLYGFSHALDVLLSYGPPPQTGGTVPFLTTLAVWIAVALALFGARYVSRLVFRLSFLRWSSTRTHPL